MSLLKEQWHKLESENTSFIYQRFEWVRTAYETYDKEHQPLIIHGKLGDEGHFIIPLTVTGGAFKTIRWPGGSHSNFCCGLYSKAFLNLSNTNILYEIIRFIGKQVAGLGMIRFSSNPPLLRGFENPLLQLPTQASINTLYEMDLQQGMDAILDAGNGKRKRKLFRKQCRVADTMGGWELFTPTTPDEIEDSLNDFFDQKSKRFAEIGVNDVFEDENAKALVRSLALEPERDGVKLLRLFELRVGGITRAMYGCGMLQNYCQAWINSVTYDDFADQSPGEMVLYAMIEQLIAEEYTLFDLGVGTERYKISWCNSSTQMFDVIQPISGASSPIVAGMKIKSSAKAYLRNHDTFWKYIKNARKLKSSIFK